MDELDHFGERLWGHVDLTRLAEHDPKSLKELCDKAVKPFGACAAICVYPADLALCRDYLSGVSIAFAAVANFPSGNESLSDTCCHIDTMLEAGADECDVVLPYQTFLDKNYRYCDDFLKTCRKEFSGALKVILETACLAEGDVIRAASQCALDAGANFLKTSTGHVSDESMHDSVRVMLKALQENPSNDAGIKVSGGVRTVEQAKSFWDIIQAEMGEDWMLPGNVRFGASRLNVA